MCLASQADVLRASSRVPAPRWGGLRDKAQKRLRGKLKCALHLQNCRFLLLGPREITSILHESAFRPHETSKFAHLSATYSLPSPSPSDWVRNLNNDDVRKRQLRCTKQSTLPFLASLTAHSPGGTLLVSPGGPIHIVMAVGFPVAFITSTTHSASSANSKYCRGGEYVVCYVIYKWRGVRSIWSLII